MMAPGEKAAARKGGRFFDPKETGHSFLLGIDKNQGVWYNGCRVKEKRVKER